jgi:hypothetical protein
VDLGDLPNNPYFGASGFIHLEGVDTYYDMSADGCGPSGENAQNDGYNGTGYGPYLIPRWFKSSGSTVRIFYTMSTWRPYHTVLMATDLLIGHC